MIRSKANRYLQDREGDEEQIVSAGIGLTSRPTTLSPPRGAGRRSRTAPTSTSSLRIKRSSRRANYCERAIEDVQEGAIRPTSCAIPQNRFAQYRHFRSAPTFAELGRCQQKIAED